MLPRQEKVEQQQEAEQHCRAWIVDYIPALVMSIGNGFGLRYGNVSFPKLGVRVWGPHISTRIKNSMSVSMWGSSMHGNYQIDTLNRKGSFLNLKPLSVNVSCVDPLRKPNPLKDLRSVEGLGILPRDSAVMDSSTSS